MESEKKPWSTPRLTVHGDVRQITGLDGAPNADTPSGPSPTAFPVGS